MRAVKPVLSTGSCGPSSVISFGMKNSQNDIARSVPRTALKQWIKSAIFFCLYYSGLEYVMARLLPSEAVAVLMYHGVCDGAMMPAHINFHVARDTFGRQMRVL